jgi:hypothetical protein
LNDQVVREWIVLEMIMQKVAIHHLTIYCWKMLLCKCMHMEVLLVCAIAAERFWGLASTIVAVSDFWAWKSETHELELKLMSLTLLVK